MHTEIDIDVGTKTPYRYIGIHCGWFMFVIDDVHISRCTMAHKRPSFFVHFLALSFFRIVSAKPFLRPSAGVDKTAPKPSWLAEVVAKLLVSGHSTINADSADNVCQYAWRHSRF